jgi:hypothetical protein
MVADQTPASSLVILRLVPLSQLPLSVTSKAFGAKMRKVTVRSGWMSGERNGVGRAAAADGGAAGGCCAKVDAPIIAPIIATVPHRRRRAIVINTSRDILNPIVCRRLGGGGCHSASGHCNASGLVQA